MKLYYHDSRMTPLVDKYLVKDYVASIVGDSYVIPTLGHWESFDEIDFDKLPEKFVLKTNHDSGGVVICKEKASFDKLAAKKKLEKSLVHNFYTYSKEWPYKNVKRCIIAEKFMEDPGNPDLKDYKWFCFDGVPKALFVASDRHVDEVETKFDFFDDNFNHLPFTHGHPNSTLPIEKPENFDEMKKLAAKLSSGFPHVRIDLYDINGKIYFGEMTFFHHGGFVAFNPTQWDYKFGSWINLPDKRIG